MNFDIGLIFLGIFLQQPLRFLFTDMFTINHQPPTTHLFDQAWNFFRPGEDFHRFSPFKILPISSYHCGTASCPAPGTHWIARNLGMLSRVFRWVSAPAPSRWYIGYLSISIKSISGGKTKPAVHFTGNHVGIIFLSCAGAARSPD